MGRSKGPPKKRHLQEEKAEMEAMEILLKAPQSELEAAAASATRQRCENWPCLDGSDSISNLPTWLQGLGTATTVPKEHFEALTALHEQIKKLSPVWASWSGSPQDPRKRAFGFLPDTLGYRQEARDSIDISQPWMAVDTEESEKERSSNNQAIVVLPEVPPGTRQAIDCLCQTFATMLQTNGTSQEMADLAASVLKYEHLVAAQPNLHCGRELLPTHVDHPTKDGFGIIIMTISMVGQGQILLEDYANTKKSTMTVSQGQAYMLSGTARNACAHGILASDGERESLNLRFGLHDWTTPAPVESNTTEATPTATTPNSLPVVSSREVLQYWETDPDKIDAPMGTTRTTSLQKEDDPNKKPRLEES